MLKHIISPYLNEICEINFQIGKRKWLLLEIFCNVRGLLKAVLKNPRIASNPEYHKLFEGALIDIQQKTIAEIIPLLGMLRSAGIITEKEQDEYGKQIVIKTDDTPRQPPASEQEGTGSRCDSCG